MELQNLTIAKARILLDEKKITAVELAEAYIERARTKNKEINAYLEIFEDVLEQAAHADVMIASGDATSLTGIPLAIKDNILIKDRIASGASKILANYTASYDAQVIEKLKSVGAVFIGRTNMDEFAMGSSTENSAYGVTKNPHDLERIPGGSSGGSAAAVAADVAVAALGTDTGGSIRQPAALCGLVGFKSTYGAVSRHGAMAMGSSLDQIGPLTKTTEDAELLFTAIRGSDSRDSTSLPKNVFSEDKVPKRIGVPRHFLKEGIDDDVLEAFEESLKKLEKDGYEIVDITLPNVSYSLAVYYIVMPAEASTNLARYDGIRYGSQVQGKDLLDDYMQTRGEGFGAEARRRILLGAFVLSAGYADAYYRKATAVRETIRNDYREAFKDVDIIATPTTPSPAFKIGEKSSDPLAMYAEDIFTVPANLAGIPAISVPMGVVQRDGVDLPVGLQFIAPRGFDSTLFVVGKDFERIVG
ncbi:Asp-tRNA(Asn)/Glu-tRNA(Gln) amidotransferase GatCAB subunit A [Candidatus Kaiserbacteria bacterium]|nr:MAG: Asp-tRNA(Asn)/Glu-tRNA(Gln) amidotransferase GatCAB subunit A [Candidatus Kaiserbacteria bacterium]